LHLAGSYLENDRQSYRETASPGNRATGYRPPPGSSAMEERALHHSTIWCLVAWMGGQSAALAVGRQQIQERNPGSACHRFLGAVAPQKFRSPQRRQVLCCARQLLHLIVEWEGLFSARFFPRFATRSGFS